MPSPTIPDHLVQTSHPAIRIVSLAPLVECQLLFLQWFEFIGVLLGVLSGIPQLPPVHSLNLSLVPKMPLLMDNFSI